MEGREYREENGAQGRIRTTDTAIFSRVLYQLSYLGTPVSWKARIYGKSVGLSSAAAGFGRN